MTDSEPQYKDISVAGEVKSLSILDKVKALSQRTKALVAAVAVVLILLVIYWLYSQGHLASLGLAPTADGAKPAEGYATLGSLKSWWNWD